MNSLCVSQAFQADPQLAPVLDSMAAYEADHKEGKTIDLTVAHRELFIHTIARWLVMSTEIGAVYRTPKKANLGLPDYDVMFRHASRFAGGLTDNEKVSALLWIVGAMHAPTVDEKAASAQIVSTINEMTRMLRIFVMTFMHDLRGDISENVFAALGAYVGVTTIQYSRDAMVRIIETHALPDFRLTTTDRLEIAQMLAATCSAAQIRTGKYCPKPSEPVVFRQILWSMVDVISRIYPQDSELAKVYVTLLARQLTLTPPTTDTAETSAKTIASSYAQVLLGEHAVMREFRQRLAQNLSLFSKNSDAAMIMADLLMATGDTAKIAEKEFVAKFNPSLN